MLRSHSYYVVMQKMSRGFEAVVDPEITRREVVSRIASGEYKNIDFIHHIHDGVCEDVTADILREAAALKEFADLLEREVDRILVRFDHARDLRKHEAAE